MPLSDFRDTYSWQEAIGLGPELVRLSEQLPATEELGLSFRLRKAMVDLPASIAYDQGEGNSFSRKIQITRIAAILDIIDKVYPALDTAVARKGLDKLVDRVAGPGFGEQTPGAAKVYMPGAMSHLRPEPGTDKPLPPPVGPEPAAPAPIEPAELAPAEPAAPADEPSSVPVTPDEEAAAAPAAPMHVTVETAPQENDVHPDSGQ